MEPAMVLFHIQKYVLVLCLGALTICWMENACCVLSTEENIVVSTQSKMEEAQIDEASMA